MILKICLGPINFLLLETYLLVHMHVYNAMHISMLRGCLASNYFNLHMSYKKPNLKYLIGVSFHTSRQDPALPVTVAGKR